MNKQTRSARSRSPERADRKRWKHHSRSRSPINRQRDNATSPSLPFNAHQLSKSDLSRYRPMFALYLDIQKQLDIDDIQENEVKGRWKSFMNKWNRGDLAEGWYDPATLEKALKASTSQDPSSKAEQEQRRSGISDDDDFGPSLPDHLSGIHQNHPASRRGPGPSIPTTSDLQAHHEQAAEDANALRRHEHSSLEYSRKLDRKLQTQRLDDLTPRAEAGSKERMLENKALAASANRSFAASAHDSGQADIPDSDVMGDEDSLGELKRMKREQERKKSEREIRKEEILRARRAEREVKLASLKQKEDKTMEMLKEIAKQRFGGGEDA